MLKSLEELKRSSDYKAIRTIETGGTFTAGHYTGRSTYRSAVVKAFADGVEWELAPFGGCICNEDVAHCYRVVGSSEQVTYDYNNDDEKFVV